MRLLATLEAFFRQRAPLGPGDSIVVAFSGGPDSTALLGGLSELALRWGFRLSAFHLDHGADAGSAGRAAAARSLAEGLGVRFRSRRIEVPALRRPGEGMEEAGRRLRYQALEEERLRLGARYVATAHHRDDQAETVALRLLFGSGLEGMAGVLPRRGAILRPLLELWRREIEEGLVQLLGARGTAATFLKPLHDPTNDDLGAQRNRLRHRILPHLEAEEVGALAALARLGERAERARARIEGRLAELLAPRNGSGSARAGRVEVGIASLLALPPELLPWALAALHRQAGAPHPPGGAARSELLRQLERRRTGARLGCDCGGGWRWEGKGDSLAVVPPAERSGEGTAAFPYTRPIPGASIEEVTTT